MSFIQSSERSEANPYYYLSSCSIASLSVLRDALQRQEVPKVLILNGQLDITIGKVAIVSIPRNTKDLDFLPHDVQVVGLPANHQSVFYGQVTGISQSFQLQVTYLPPERGCGKASTFDDCVRALVTAAMAVSQTNFIRGGWAQQMLAFTAVPVSIMYYTGQYGEILFGIEETSNDALSQWKEGFIVRIPAHSPVLQQLNQALTRGMSQYFTVTAYIVNPGVQHVLMLHQIGSPSPRHLEMIRNRQPYQTCPSPKIPFLSYYPKRSGVATLPSPPLLQLPASLMPPPSSLWQSSPNPLANTLGSSGLFHSDVPNLGGCGMGSTFNVPQQTSHARTQSLPVFGSFYISGSTSIHSSFHSPTPSQPQPGPTLQCRQCGAIYSILNGHQCQR